MRITPRLAAVPAVFVAAMMLAAPAAAAPECTDLTPTTRICQNPGHTQITTTPGAALTDPFPVMYGGFGTALRSIFNGR